MQSVFNMALEYKLSECNPASLRKNAKMQGVDASVSEILSRVKSQGDEGILFYERKFGGIQSIPEMRISQDEIKCAKECIPPKLLSALQFAAKNIRETCTKSVPKEKTIDNAYAKITQRTVPIKSAGIYAPGGKAAYPSTVLMCAIPAQVAGVEKLILCSPSPSDAVLAACAICGIKEVYAIGGAQAIAAMAYGTQTVPKVQKIVGPGNSYVTEAKRQVRSETCDIDMLAGPTEVLIIADESANARTIAADCLAQLEHGEDSIAVVICKEEMAAEIRKEASSQAKTLSRSTILQKSLQNLILVTANFEDLQQIVDFSNEFAPEHLEIQLKSANKLLPLIRYAGAIFVGENSCEAFGDYCVGSNHVLPTGGSAKFAGGLSVSSFMKTVEIIEVKKSGLATLAENTAEIANAEGLQAHAKSALERIKK
ncbi:Histidinol dehydrogenase [Candidatus Anstonella stagnisolia]|nr:Histidinol dehydrogenase [Candidatus Anstonella stagnisolia]